MRIVFVGAGTLTVRTARLLLERGHEVVIIEKDRDRIQELSDELACGYLHGDGSKPAILREAAPEETDVLFCLTDDDRVNIIASVVGKTLGFKRVTTKILDSEFRTVCHELGLSHIIVPSETISRYLADLVRGRDILELSTMIRGEARFFSFMVGDREAGTTIGDLKLPESARVICYYRGGSFHLAEFDRALKKDDEVVILTHSRHLQELHERWESQFMEESGTSNDESEEREDEA